jgi:hypothetical protein
MLKKNAVAIIPARGGSKRIKRKNIKDFHGLPLIAYSIKAALESNLFEKVIVTTDDEEIAKIAKEYGAEVPFLRPKELSDDFTGTGDVVKHEFAEMVKAIRDTEKLLGKVDYSMTDKKKKSRQFSRSLYVAKDIKKGDMLTLENVRSVRPGFGMHPKRLKDILGKISDKDYQFGDRLNINIGEDK